MNGKSLFFKHSRVYWWGGFYIPVRNSWSHAIEQRHLSVKEREMYEADFGERIISDTEFYAWINKYLVENKDNA